MYGLETAPSVDGSLALAMKPTRFPTSSMYMARRRQKRYDHSHIHQQFVGGRCKDVAYYPLPLVRAILRGMHHTTMVEGNEQQEMEEMGQTLNAIRDHPTKFQRPLQPPMKSEPRWSRWGGGNLSINCGT